jgi:hypothetical protein
MLVVLAMLGWALPGTGLAAGADALPIQGRVTDAAGQPLVGVSVVLEASRTAFRWRSFQRQTSEPVQVPTASDADGRFSFDWRRDRHFTNLQLLVGLPVRKGGRDTFEVFLRQDISEQARNAEGPFEIYLTVEESAQLDWLRRFLVGKVHADEDKVYRELGRPDRLDHDEVLDESSWWYFAAGKVYHFRAGALQQVTHFEPPSAEGG